MDEQEIKAYLNYEDVQKELETAKELIKELLLITDDIVGGMDCFPNRKENNEERNLRALTERAEQFLK